MKLEDKTHVSIAKLRYLLTILVVIRTCMQGLGSKILPLVSSIIELCGKILFTAWVIPVLGIWGIIICEPLIWCVMFMHLAYAYHKTIRQLESKI